MKKKYLIPFISLSLAICGCDKKVDEKIIDNPYTPVTWSLSVIDSEGEVGSGNDIKIDPGGGIHISYCDNTNGYLKYATNKDGEWSITNVDSTEDAVQCSSLAIDNYGKAHISYGRRRWDSKFYAWEYTGLKYATNSSGQWVITTIDSSVNLADNTCISLDSNGKVHIGCTSIMGDGIYYFNNVSGSWVIQNVFACSSISQGISLAVDNNTKVHIAYNGNSINGDDALYYATNATGPWNLIKIYSTGNTGYQPSIAIDNTGKAHISFYSYSEFQLKYATNASGQWIISTVDDVQDSGNTSIVLDKNGKVFISYTDLYNKALNSNNYLKYATNVSGPWINDSIDISASSVYSGSYGWLFTSNSIAFDNNWRLCISYNDVTNGDLKLAIELAMK